MHNIQNHIGNPVLSLEELEALPFYRETIQNAGLVNRSPSAKLQQAIPEPIEQLHPNPPIQQHSLSQ